MEDFHHRSVLREWKLSDEDEDQESLESIRVQVVENSKKDQTSGMEVLTNDVRVPVPAPQLCFHRTTYACYKLTVFGDSLYCVCSHVHLYFIPSSSFVHILDKMSKKLPGRLLDTISTKKMHLSLSIKDKVKVKKKWSRYKPRRCFGCQEV
jgi:hypothetical protein